MQPRECETPEASRTAMPWTLTIILTIDQKYDVYPGLIDEEFISIINDDIRTQNVTSDVTPYMYRRVSKEYDQKHSPYWQTKTSRVRSE